MLSRGTWLSRLSEEGHHQCCHGAPGYPLCQRRNIFNVVTGRLVVSCIILPTNAPKRKNIVSEHTWIEIVGNIFDNVLLIFHLLWKTNGLIQLKH